MTIDRDFQRAVRARTVEMDSHLQLVDPKSGKLFAVLCLTGRARMEVWEGVRSWENSLGHCFGPFCVSIIFFKTNIT